MLTRSMTRLVALAAAMTMLAAPAAFGADSEPAAEAPAPGTPGSQQLATPWLPPAVETDPTKRIQWPSLSVVFEADALRIKARGKTFRGVISAEFVQSWAGVDDRNYDIMWLEHGREMRMDISFDSDGSDYWISRWMVYDGRKDPEWAVFRGPLFRTPLDEPMEADVRLATGKGKRRVELVVPGMRIHAFHPGSGPAPLTDCTPPEPLDAEAIATQELAAHRATFSDAEWEAYRERVGPRVRRDGLSFEEALVKELARQVKSNPVIEPPRSRGEGFTLGELQLEGWVEPEHQFGGTGIWTMPLAEVETMLRDAGVCFEYSYAFTDQRIGSAASEAQERWCTAPPRGELDGLLYLDDVLRVQVYDDAVHATRDMPPAGWNCPTN